MSDVAIKIDNLKKRYKLGAIGGQTLNAELQSWWARKRGKEDPNLKIGEDYSNAGETFWALNGIDLEVQKGEALGIIGANGAGKSTLLKILSRVTAPTEGDVWINGRIASMLEVGTGFHGELTGRENIYMNGAILGMTKKEVDQKIESIIDFSECRQFIDTPVKRYSSGMYVKLAFAVASHLDAEIMVMDEVLAVGDMKFQKKCLGKMGDAAANEGRTVLYVSHNMNTVRNLCTKCVVLKSGQIIYNGDVENAIQVYLDHAQMELKTYHDMRNYIRHTFDLGKKFFIKEIELKGKKTARYYSTEAMVLKITWQAMQATDRLKIGFSVKYVDGTNVGFVESQNFIAAECGKVYTSIYEYDLSNLAQGTYILYINMFEVDNIGALHSVDQVDKIYFEVEDNDDNLVVWQRIYWGSVRLNRLKLVEQEEIDVTE